MRIMVLILAIFASTSVFADSVQLSKSSYHGQHVTIEDKGDFYLLHCNVYFKLDQPLEDGETRFLHVSVAHSRDGTLSDVFRVKRSVKIEKREAIWSFYFRVPKFDSNKTQFTYAVIASLDGVEQEAAAIWKFEGGGLKLGTAQAPLAMYYPVGRKIMQDDGAGGFRLVVVYEVRVYENNYDSLPICGFLKSDKHMPATVNAEQSAKRL